jgi:hypothetical protein
VLSGAQFPVITATWSGQAVTVLSYSSPIVLDATSGNLKFSAQISLLDKPSLVLPDSEPIIYNVSF